jgi:hypothetical protein
LAFPKLEARVGVADDTDVGVYFAKNIQSNYGWLGFDVKHALLRQGLDVPVTVSLRGAYTKTLFIHDMDMHALSAGVTAAHTLWNTVTPYAGVGTDVVFARERSSAVDLHSELVVTPNALAGIEVAVWRVAIGFEAQVGPVATAQARTTFVF